MTADTTHKLDMLKRINRFIVDHPFTSAIPRATSAHAEVVAIITALEAAAQKQASGSSESEGGVDLRAIIARTPRVPQGRQPDCPHPRSGSSRH
jgi:hypothetical protein